MNICVKLICLDVLPGEIIRGREKEEKRREVSQTRCNTKGQCCGAISFLRESLWLSCAGEFQKEVELHLRVVSVRGKGAQVFISYE